MPPGGFRALGAWRALKLTASGGCSASCCCSIPPRDDADKTTIATAAEMGVKNQDGHGRRARDRPRDGQDVFGTGEPNILDGASLGDLKMDETQEVAKSIEDADRFRSGISRTQVPHCRRAAEARPYRRHEAMGSTTAPALKKAAPPPRSPGRPTRRARLLIGAPPPPPDAMKASGRNFQR